MHAPTAPTGHDVSFGALIEKVKQAETALEAKERQASADWRQLKASWVAAWTPGRIVAAGLASGFLVGVIEPAKRVVGGNSVLQLLGTAAGLFAGGSAQAAAGKAEDAADSAQQTVETVAPEAAMAPTAAVAPVAAAHTPDTLREAGQL